MAVVELGVVELEHCVELLDRRVIAAQLADQPALVVRHEPRILPGVPLGIVAAVIDRGGVEGGAEAAVALARAQKAGLGVEAVAPVERALLEPRSEENTSELQSQMRISSTVFCLKKKIKH